MAFMTHPQHGATNTQDVDEHVKNGWVVNTHEAWLAAKAKPVAAQPVQADAPKQRGRKSKADQ